MTVKETLSTVFLQSYIQPAMVKVLFDKDGILKNTGVLSKITININSSEMSIQSFLENLPENMKKAPTEKNKSDNQITAQQEDISANIMLAANYVLGTLQSFIVSGKDAVNYITQKIGGPVSWINFSYSDAEKLEAVRKRLVSEKITIVDIAKLFEINEESIILKKDISVKFQSNENRP